MTRDLKSRVREFERPPAVAAAGVLGADQFLEHIEMRALDARSEPVANVLRKLTDLGNDPAQDVTRQNHRGRFFQTGFFPAGAFGAGGHLNHALGGVGHLAPRHYTMCS